MNKIELRNQKYELDGFGEIIELKEVKGYFHLMNKLKKLLNENNNLVFNCEFGISQIIDNCIIDSNEKKLNLQNLQVFEINSLIEDIYIELNNNELVYLSDYGV